MEALNLVGKFGFVQPNTMLPRYSVGYLCYFSIGSAGISMTQQLVQDIMLTYQAESNMTSSGFVTYLEHTSRLIYVSFKGRL